jgi:hypothetical protein
VLLLGNVFITHPNGQYHRGHLPPSDQLDIFKYTLASYAVIPQITRVKLQIALDPPWAHRWAELKDWVAQHFGEKAEVVAGRCVKQDHWWGLAKELLVGDDELIWLVCNHDHVFMDYALDALTAVHKRLLEDITPERTCYYSHYTEFIRSMQSMPEYEILEDGVIRTMWKTRDSPQIVSKYLLHRWWDPSREVGNLGERYMPRTDWGGIWECPPYLCYLAPRQLCRHFDGYSHLFDFTRMPPLAIPPGFFEEQIRIRYGYDTPRPGWVHINPKIPTYRAGHPDGVDYRWVLEDIPLFWKNRISEIEVRPGTDREEMLAARNQALRDYMLVPGAAHHDVGRFLPREESLARMMRC